MPIDSYNDSSTAQTPAKTGTRGSTEGAGPSPSAKGTPSIVKADGTENMRADTKTIQAAHASTPSGTKKTGADVQSYSDHEV